MWRVIRCAFHRRNATIADLRDEGFVIHDSYLNTAGVQAHEEYTIVAKRIATA